MESRQAVNKIVIFIYLFICFNSTLIFFFKKGDFESVM